MASTATARPGPTEHLLLPGSIHLSKEGIVSDLAKPSVWGKIDKKKGVLFRVTEMRETFLAKVAETSQDLKTVLLFGSVSCMVLATYHTRQLDKIS
jgi:hypothetical protein